MTTKVIYTIPNISCGHCVHTIQSELIELPGIKLVMADQNTKMTTIEYEAPANEEKIKALLASIDYPVAG